MSLVLPAVAGNYASSPDSVAVSLSGDFSLRVALKKTLWIDPAVSQRLLAKAVASGNQQSYGLRIVGGTGRLRLFTSVDGSALVNDSATANPPWVNGQPLLLRADMTRDNGSAHRVFSFYYRSYNPATVYADLIASTGWTLLETNSGQGNLGALFDSTALVEVGSQDLGQTGPAEGEFYAAAILNGPTGSVVWGADFTNSAAPLVDKVNAAVLTINTAGAGQVARLDFQTAPTAAEIAAAVAARTILDHGDGSYLRNTEPPTADAIAALAAARAWDPAYASPRTLTSSAAEMVAAVQGSKLVLTRGNSWLADVTGLGNITGWTKIWWTAKKSVDDSDAHAKVQIVNPGGLLVVNGIPATAGDGSLEVLDASAGNVRLYISASATKSLQRLTDGVQGFQWEDANGDIWPLPQGEFEIDADTTRAVD